MEKNVFKILACMAVIAMLAPNKASATTFDDDETVVFDGIHYMLNDNDKTAETHWAIFPLIRTGVLSKASSYPYPDPICYYDRGENYEALGSLVIPENVGEYTVTEIGDYSFHNSGVTNVTISSKVKRIGEGAFIWNDALSSLELPDGVKTIGDNAFRFCKSLTTVALPSSVQSIGYGCFADCDMLATFSTGDGLTTIPNGAFARCEKMMTLNIGKSIEKITGWAFIGCDALRNIYIDENNSTFSYTDGKLMNTSTKTLVYCSNIAENVYRIPAGTIEIGECALIYNSNVKCLVLPASVSAFGLNSVAECPNLTSVHAMAAVPPVIDPYNQVFSNIARHCTLNVPVGSLELYKEAPVWKDFKEIVENPTTGVDDIEASSAAADNNVYSLDGRIVKQNATNLDDLGEGIYIHQGKKHFIKK